jgi:hypothetical protein
MATTNVASGYHCNPFAFALPVVQPNQPIPSAQDPTALAPDGGNDVGNVGRNVLRGPSQSNIDFSIAKRFALRESKSVVLRTDFFNVLNHANRSNPISDITTASAFDASGGILSPGDFGRSLTFDSSPRIISYRWASISDLIHDARFFLNSSMPLRFKHPSEPPQVRISDRFRSNRIIGKRATIFSRMGKLRPALAPHVDPRA